MDKTTSPVSDSQEQTQAPRNADAWAAFASRPAAAEEHTSVPGTAAPEQPQTSALPASTQDLQAQLREAQEQLLDASRRLQQLEEAARLRQLPRQAHRLPDPERTSPKPEPQRPSARKRPPRPVRQTRQTSRKMSMWLLVKKAVPPRKRRPQGSLPVLPCTTASSGSSQPWRP